MYSQSPDFWTLRRTLCQATFVPVWMWKWTHSWMSIPTYVCVTKSVKEESSNVTWSLVAVHQRQSCIGGFLLCRSTQFSKEDNWLCSTISPSRWYTGQLWQSRTSSPAALPPPNLPDLNLLLPSREESWRVDTFKFHILHSVINSLSGRAWIQDCMKQPDVILMLQCCATSCHIRCIRLYYK